MGYFILGRLHSTTSEHCEPTGRNRSEDAFSNFSLYLWSAFQVLARVVDLYSKFGEKLKAFSD